MPSEDLYLPIRYADALPAELVTTTLSHLPATDLLCCSRVSQRFNRIIKGSVLLQYHIALGRVGAVDNPSSRLSTAVKLDRLLAQERAWSSLNPTRRDVIPIPRRLGSFDLCGGVLVGAKAPDSTDEEDTQSSTDPEEDSLSGNACELLGMRLPSVISGKVDVPTWSRNVGFPVYGLGIDASQDLAVIIQARIEREDPFLVHFMTLSAFIPHAGAKQAVLEYNPGISVSQVSVRCFGNVIGIMFHSFDHDVSHQSLIIYDWKTGVTKACIDSAKERRFFDDFGFLTSDIIVLPSRKPNPASLDVYMFEKKAAPRRSSRLACGSIPSAVRIASFELPLMRTPLEVSVNTICCNSEIPPLTSSLPPSSSSSTPTSSSPFQLDPACALLSFSFMVCHGHSAAATAGAPLHERFTLVVQRKAFLGRIEDILRTTRGRWPGASFKPWALPWTNWGPNISRWITMKHLSWACFVSGTRIVMSPPAKAQDDDQALCHLRILDFNPFIVAKESEERRLAASRDEIAKVEFCAGGGTLERRGAHAAVRSGKGKQREDTSLSATEQGRADEEMREISVRLIDGPSRIPPSKLWLEPIESRLPYRQVTTKETFAFANVVIDEERIGAIMVNESGDLTDVHMFTM
ncbi:hypothetical protein FRB95_011083 [Tulasnella sp. JGI-2019a]|nr:hypothetical protein FRB95_011083 [Tulasnella sp. JGI-2019a]